MAAGSMMSSIAVLLPSLALATGPAAVLLRHALCGTSWYLQKPPKPRAYLNRSSSTRVRGAVRKNHGAVRRESMARVRDACPWRESVARRNQGPHHGRLWLCISVFPSVRLPSLRRSSRAGMLTIAVTAATQGAGFSSFPSLSCARVTIF